MIVKSDFSSSKAALRSEVPTKIPAMSKKRKRHQDREDSAALEDVSLPTEEGSPLESPETTTAKGLTAEQESNVQKKIFHSIKETSRAFKKARDFEVRKIIKRIKTSKYVLEVLFNNREKAETDKVERLEKELQIAKVQPFLSC
jgi:hypothetical protein